MDSFFNIDNFLLDSPVVETMFATVTDIELGKINVNKIYQSTAGHIWVLSDTGLFQFRDNEWVEHFKNEDQKRAFKAILEKPNGDILVGDDKYINKPPYIKHMFDIIFIVIIFTRDKRRHT